ncbi:hypothetical protein LINPERHAP2_LOCUS41898 [Linum perenne]
MEHSYGVLPARTILMGYCCRKSNHTTHCAEGLQKWNVKVGKAFYVLSVTGDDSLLPQNKKAKTPAEA